MPISTTIRGAIVQQADDLRVEGVDLRSQPGQRMGVVDGGGHGRVLPDAVGDREGATLAAAGRSSARFASSAGPAMSDRCVGERDRSGPGKEPIVVAFNQLADIGLAPLRAAA